MRVESYQEDDMRLAMAKVRAEMGSDAVIISSRRVAGRTEIMAACDYDPNELEAEIKKLTQRKSAKKTEKKAKKEEDKNLVWEMLSEKKENEENGPSLSEVQDELGRLRKLFEGELAQLAWRDVGTSQPNRLALMSRLETVGINREIGGKLVEKVLPCEDLELAWRRVLRLLSRVIHISQDDVLDEGGVIALIGPTGVGKTTTAAKIAAQFALRHGRKQVAFISTDSYRVGGQEQLISLGGILGIPVQVATTPEEMKKTLESFSERKLVIIDTAGISQRSSELSKQFEMLKNNDIKIKPYLVLSATSQEAVINETIKAFTSLKPSAAIITKTDEGGSIGTVLSGLLRYKLPTAFLGNGQQVPEDLQAAHTDIFMTNIIESYSESMDQLQRQKARANRKQVANV